MNKKKILAFIIFSYSSFLYSSESDAKITKLPPTKPPATYVKPPDGKKYVIGSWYFGFFSNFFCALNHLMWCDEHDKIPVIYWNNISTYYQQGGYNGSTNVWEYYFEPVSPLAYNAQDKIYNYYWNPDNTGFYYDMLDDGSRMKAQSIIKKHIKIKPSIQKKIDTFYNEKIAGKLTVGIHIRGTDKILEEESVSLQEVIQYSKKFNKKKFQFLIASEDSSVFEYLKKHIDAPVIFYNSFRTTSTQLAWWQYLPNKAQLGEEVLIEVQLLSRCNFLIHNYSNVSTAALYFNPQMPHKLFQSGAVKAHCID